MPREWDHDQVQRLQAKIQSVHAGEWDEDTRDYFHQIHGNQIGDLSDIKAGLEAFAPNQKNTDVRFAYFVDIVGDGINETMSSTVYEQERMGLGYLAHITSSFIDRLVETGGQHEGLRLGGLRRAT